MVINVKTSQLKSSTWGLDTDGFILKHGVVKDESSSIFNGIGRIAKGATRSNAVQESRVLMLSEKARGDANPILLIDEDDVTAGHAASVGRVDPLAIVLPDEPRNFTTRSRTPCHPWFPCTSCQQIAD